MPKILLFTNTVAPYRLPVFQQLAQAVDLYVLFAQGKTADRRWRVQPETYTFRHTVLSHRTLRLGSVAQVINPALLAYLRHTDFDVAILGDNRQTVLSGLLVELIALVRRRPLIVWSGITPGEASVARSGYGLQRLFSLYRRSLFRRLPKQSVQIRHKPVTKRKVIAADRFNTRAKGPGFLIHAATLGMTSAER